MKAKSSNKGGRPTVMTLEVISKLEEAFSHGATDKEAIFVADISAPAFYNYCQAHPEFIDRIELLRDNLKYRARLNVSEAIKKGDEEVSQWYLERKVKDEFSTRTEQTGKEGKDLIPDKATEEDKAKKADAFDKWYAAHLIEQDRG